MASSGGNDDSYDWEFELGRQLSWQEILIAEEDSRPIGVVVLIDAAEDESHYWGVIEPRTWAIDIWIGRSQDRAKGFGTQMMKAALERCFVDHEALRVVIDPLITNERAIRFYRRIGFRDVGPRWFSDDHCLVLKILLSNTEWHQRHGR